METIGIWIAAILTIAVYSFLFKENALFTLTEHLFLGLATGHAMVIGYQNVVNDAVVPLVRKGQFLWAFPLLGGALLLMRLVPRVSWVSRIPLGFMMGVAAGLSLKRAIDSEFWRQVDATMVYAPVTVDNIIYVVTVLTVLAYFFFGVSTKTKRGLFIIKAGMVGQYLMMVAFGAALGAAIMGRISLVISRFQFLFGVWLPIFK